MNLKYSDHYVKLGLTIQYYRKLGGLTQEQLAEQAGIERTHMGYIEQARAGASLDTIFGIADALDLPVHKLFEFRE